MGLVLAFDTAPRTVARPPLKRMQPAKSADILFFTGVRYERAGEARADHILPASKATSPTPAS